jgi:hypothetical protein
MQFHVAYVYVNGVSVASTTYDHGDNRIFSDVAYKQSRGKIRARPADCTHSERIGGYVYVEWLDQHWPIEFCDECLTVLHGRERHAAETDKPLWERTEADAAHDLDARQWNAEWPREGKPRRKRPAAVAWPDAAAGSDRR